MPDTADPTLPKSVKFHYIKGNAFRVIHADGVIGGNTPSGNVHCAFFSERPAIPQTTEQEVSPEGQLGPMVSSEGKAGIVRELDVDIHMSLPVAVQVRDWLTKLISQLKEPKK